MACSESFPISGATNIILDPSSAPHSAKTPDLTPISLGGSIVADTPTKQGLTLGMSYGEKAVEIEEEVEQALRGNVRIISQDDFVNNLFQFPISEELESALKDMENDDDIWQGFPRLGTKVNELRYYKPLVKLAEKINEKCQQSQPNGKSGRKWVDCHTTAPQTLSQEKSALRPDIVLVSNVPSGDFSKYQERLNHISPNKLDANQERDVRVWWSHIHTIIEVKAKPESAKKLHTHIVQLCKYMRQMFCEQLDRRFIMGLLLCGDELTMWLCDRTGLIGTIEPVNIYEQRGRFIQILAAFSMLSPNRIGWDESMKLYQPKTKEHLESYLVPLDHKKSLHQLNWVISMPFENDPKAREEFVTIRAIMAAPAQIIYSRATIVWEVVRLRDIEEKKLEPEVLVLKQIWQLIEEDSESEGLHEALMYEAAGFKSDRLYSQEFVSTPDGLIDSTERNRRNSKVMTYSNAAKELEGKQGETPAQSTAGKKRPRDENEEPYCYIRIAAEVRNNIFKTKGNKILARALARMLMKKGGYPLKDFIDDLELLRAVRDAVKDHQDMYERGVLHRDISMGNILLCDDGTKCTGMLIDLDNAKRTQQKIHFPARETPPGIVLLVELFEYNMDPEIWEGAARYIERLDDLLAYLSHLWKKRPPYLQQITTKNLNWSPDFQSAEPDFRQRVAREGFQRTGTEPFLSVEISMKKRLRDEDTGPPIHNAVHDMESFLWVLLYIAITRTGTGMRRPEFNLDPDSDNDLRDIAKELFESGVSRKARCLFQHEELEIVLKYIHPDFENFKDLFRKWRWSVLNGHLFKAVEHYNIHKIVLNILDETITLVKRKEDDKYATELKKKKDEPRTTWNRRRKCWAPRTNDGNRRQTTRKPDSEEQLLDENDVEDYEIKYYDGYSPQGKAQGRVPKPQSEAESPARGPMLKKPKFE